MPRKLHFCIPGVPVHLIQRGHNRAACFFSDGDYRYYRQSLAEGAHRYGCAIHANVLMAHHAQWLVTVNEEREEVR